MALLFLFNVTKKEGESSLPCPDIYLVNSRKVGVIQVLPLVSVRVLQRSRTSKMEMDTHKNIWEVVGGGERRRQRERHTGISRTCVIVWAGKFRIYMASWWLETLGQESMLQSSGRLFSFSLKPPPLCSWGPSADWMKPTHILGIIFLFKSNWLWTLTTTTKCLHGNT